MNQDNDDAGSEFPDQDDPQVKEILRKMREAFSAADLQ